MLRYFQRLSSECVIPVPLIFKGERHPLLDWSQSGFSMDSIDAESMGRQIKSILVFPFDDLEIRLSVEAEVIWVDTDERRAGFWN